MEAYKLQKIDESLLQEHSELDPSDVCYFFGDYASGRGYQHSPMNNLINNLKKDMDRKDKPEWYYKEKAIDDIANLLTSTSLWKKLKLCTWIPFPPSKKKDHPEYDDRLLKILYHIRSREEDLDIRELLLVKSNREPAHKEGKRLSKEEHIRNLNFQSGLVLPKPKALVIFDDVITLGASFKAGKEILSEKFKGLPIIGIFIARRVDALFHFE